MSIDLFAVLCILVVLAAAALLFATWLVGHRRTVPRRKGPNRKLALVQLEPPERKSGGARC